jgi:two-component system, OmpR family, phosphate regulon sensor histidine kinase PhoR
MNRALRVPLHYKITVVISLIIAVFFTAVFFYLNNTLKQHTYERISDNLRTKANLSRSYVQHYLLAGLLLSDIDKLADEMGKELNLRVTIIGKDGVVHGDSQIDSQKLAEVENHLFRPEVQEALNRGFGQSRRYSETIAKDLLYSAVFFDSGRYQGVVRLAMPLSEIQEVTHRLKRLVGLSFFFAFFLVLTISFITSSFISRPLRDIAAAARMMAKGDFSKKIVVGSNDEIGSLASDLNHMAEEIKAKINEVIAGRTRLEAVFLSMFEGVMIVDNAGAIVLVNKTLKDFLSIDEDPYGKKPLEVVRNIAIQEITEQALSLKKDVVHREIVTMAQQEKILSVNATAVKFDQTVKGAVLVFHDITELRRLETIRRDFVANVSHELRTPVTTIKGYAETLREGALEDREHAREFVNIIYEDAKRLSQLIDDILDLSKIESGRLVFDRQAHYLGGIIDYVIREMKPYADKRGISIESEISKPLPQVFIDKQSLEQVLLNLIDNAIKYNRPNGKVVVKALAKGSFVEVSVEDTGIGIAEKDLSRIFERFYRADKARSRELGGTGLGLSIVKHIIQSFSGSVNVSSVPGQGSVFTFTIPLA